MTAYIILWFRQSLNQIVFQPVNKPDNVIYLTVNKKKGGHVQVANLISHAYFLEDET
jgi:hypothetical protein